MRTKHFKSTLKAMRGTRKVTKCLILIMAGKNKTRKPRGKDEEGKGKRDDGIGDRVSSGAEISEEPYPRVRQGILHAAGKPHGGNLSSLIRFLFFSFFLFPFRSCVSARLDGCNGIHSFQGSVMCEEKRKRTSTARLIPHGIPLHHLPTSTSQWRKVKAVRSLRSHHFRYLSFRGGSALLLA